MAQVRLEEVAEESRETYKGDKTGMPIVGLEHLIPGEVTLTNWDTDTENTFTKCFRKGDMLFGRRRAYLKKAALAPVDGICSGDITVIRAKANCLLPELLPFIIQNDSLFEFAVGRSAGSLSPRVRWDNLKNYTFELPSMEEQRKLAEVLWAINDTLQAYQNLLTETDALVQAQFIERFGDPHTNPNKWPMAKLASLGELARGVSKARPRNQPELLGGKYPLIQTGEITNSGAYITHHENTYSELGLAQSRMWPKGTLCITIAANIAQTGILTYDACFPDSVVGFISDGRVEQIFIHYWFTFFQELLEAQAVQVAQKNINLKTLGELDVYLPPTNRQKEFVAFFHQTENSKTALQNAITSLQATKRCILENALGTERKE